MLSLTPPALHSLHSIYSGGVSASGGVLGLLGLMCACANKGENFGRSDRTRGDLFDFWKTCCAQGFKSASFWESCTCESDGKTLLGEFLLWFWLLVSSFSLCFLHDCVERYLCLWGVIFWLLIDCVEPLPLPYGIDLCLSKWLFLPFWAFCHLLEFFSFVLLCSSLVSLLLVRFGVLTMHSSRGRLKNESTLSCLW